MELIFANITIFIIALNVLLGFFFKPKNSSYLCCGLFGYCGSTPPDLLAIKILGLFNQERGTDSCGLALNDVVTKGFNDTAKFEKLIQVYDFETPDDNFTVIGHTRRATHGIKSEANAHPFEIYKDANDADPTLILAHNGVIKNWIELCKEYGVDTKDINVDSLGLGSIIAKKKENIKVLKEYRGGAALLFYPLEKKNCLYLFHGLSKEYKHSIAKEERPLFYWKVKDKDQVYVSSLKEALSAIGGGGKGNEIYEVEHNKLILIQNGKFVNLKPSLSNMDRSEFVNDIPTTYNTSAWYSHDDHNFGRLATNNRASGGKQTVNQSNFPSQEVKPKGKEETQTEWTQWKDAGTNGVLMPKNIAIDTEPKDTIYNQKLHGNKIYFWQGRYWRNGHLAGGKNDGLVTKIDNEGVEYDKPGCNSISLEMYYFINGLLCKGLNSYNILYDEFRKENGGECFVYFMDKGKQKCKPNTRFLSIHAQGFVHSIGCEYGDAYVNGTMFDGLITPKFSNKTYKFHKGDFVSWSYVNKTKMEYIKQGGIIAPDKEEVQQLSLLEPTNNNSFNFNSCKNNSCSKDIEDEMKEVLKQKEDDKVEWAKGVPQEEPTIKDAQLAKEEEHLDLFLDNMNNLKDGAELIQEELAKGDTTSGSYAMVTKLRSAYNFLHEWFSTRWEEDDVDAIQGEALANQLIEDNNKQKDLKKEKVKIPLY